MTARVPWSRLLPPAAFAAAFALLAWIVLSHHLYAVDTGPHHWSVAHRPHAAVVAARLVTDAGTGVFPPLVAASGGWLAGLAAYGGGPAQVAPAGGRRARIRGALPLALLALVVLLAGQVVRTGLMAALRRGRPPVADWAVRASGHSFPSGHTASSAIAAGLLTWGLLRLRLRPDRPLGHGGVLSRVLVALCWLVAAAIGCTRVYLGVHWPTDVLGGWLFAGFWLAATVPLLTYAAEGRGTRKAGQDRVEDGEKENGGGGDSGEPGGGDGDDRGDQTDTP